MRSSETSEKKFSISSQHFCFLKYYQWTQPEGGRKQKSLCQHLQTRLKLCTEGVWPGEAISLFPIQATYTHLQKRVGRRSLVLSLCPTHSSSISGHWEGKFWTISNCICLGKGHLSWGAGRAPPHSQWSTANPSYERHKTVRKIVCRIPSRREQICATDGVSLLAESFGGKKRNNGLVFGGLRALPCFYHNGSLNLPSQMGTGYGILQSSSP